MFLDFKKITSFLIVMFVSWEKVTKAKFKEEGELEKSSWVEQDK